MIVTLYPCSPPFSLPILITYCTMHRNVLGSIIPSSSSSSSSSLYPSNEIVRKLVGHWDDTEP